MESIFVAYCTLYCTAFPTAYYIVYRTVYCTVYCTILCTVYCKSDTFCVRHRTAEQIILKRKLTKKFSSNNECDGSLMSEIKYIRRKYTPKRRKTFNKLNPFLKREAESAFDEPNLKRQRILLISRMLNM